MDKALNRSITIISVCIFVIVALASGMVLLFTDTNFMEGPGPIVSIILGFCVLSIITSAVINKERMWIKKTSKFSLIFYPLLIITAVPVFMFFENISLINILAILLILFFTLFFVMQLFLFADATALTGNIVFISLIILWLYLKRFHLMYSGYFISIIILLFSMGSFMYGIRCFYLAGKNSFLKYTAFWCSCLIVVSFIGLLCKIQHWPGGHYLLSAGNILLVSGTVIVLVTLPFSDYFDWQPVHKKILKRLILPWTLMFALFIIRFLLPEVQTVIWNTPSPVSNYGFEMIDYEIKNKDELILE